VLRTILGKAKRGTKVIFVPGNHDEVFREFDGAVFGNLEIHREYIHRAPTAAACWCCTATNLTVW
jgi:UDP-2,3-diacylglucosamine pyrophosphatase LpxH